jgi:hypothetical protein
MQFQQFPQTLRVLRISSDTGFYLPEFREKGLIMNKGYILLQALREAALQMPSHIGFSDPKYFPVFWNAAPLHIPMLSGSEIRIP